MTSASDEKCRPFNFFSRVGLRTYQHSCIEVILHHSKWGVLPLTKISIIFHVENRALRYTQIHYLMEVIPMSYFYVNKFTMNRNTILNFKSTVVLEVLSGV